MNRKVEGRIHEISGSPNEKIFKIVKFHETRLGRIERFLHELEKKTSTNGDSTRMDTLEENLNVAFDSLQRLGESVKVEFGKVGKVEDKVNRMASKGSNTTKLAVMNEQLRLMAVKFEELERLVTTLTNAEGGEDEDEDEDENEEEGAVVEEETA